MQVVFNYNDYLKNPVAELCVSKLENPTILTLEDIKPDLMKLHHAKESYENVYIKKNFKSLPSFIGDQLRLYYALQNDNFFYCDADCYITKEQQKKIYESKNCIYYGKKIHEINNGTFFCSDTGCEFNQYYFDLYENKDLKDVTNVNVFFKYPFHLDFKNEKAGDMNLLNLNVKHFILSKFSTFKNFYYDRYSKKDIYYTFKTPKELKKSPSLLVWQLGEKADDEKYLYRNNGTAIMFQWKTEQHEDLTEQFQIELFKEQMRYTLQNPNIKFIEV